MNKIDAKAFYSVRNLWLIWVGICLIFAYMAWPLYWGQGADYALYYSIGELFRAGQGLDIYVTGEQGPWYGYPPLVAPIFTVLQWIPLTRSREAFFALKIILMCLWPILFSLCKTKEKNKNTTYAFAMIATMAVFPAIFEEILAANINTFLLTLAFAAIALTKYGYFTVAAAIFTFNASFKPQYSFFFLPVLMLAPKRAVLGGLLTVSALVLLSVELYGYNGFISLTTRWIELMSTPLAGPNDVNNMSTTGVLARLMTPMGLSQSGEFQNANLFNMDYENSILFARLGAGALVLGLIFTAIRQWKFRHDERLLELYSVIVLVTLLVTPVIWLTHYMLLVVPLFAVFHLYFRTSKWLAGGTVIAAAASLYLASQMFQNTSETWVLARTYGLPYWVLVAVSLLFIFAKRGNHNET